MQRTPRAAPAVGRAAILAAIAAAATLPAAAQAQTFPSRPVSLVVGFQSGSGADILARVLGPKLAERWGQGVVVENKPGASGNIGSDAVAKAKPDGHTILMAINTFTMTPALYKSMPFDPVNDFLPVTKIAVADFALAAHPSVNASDLASLVALAKPQPGKINYGSPGNGTPHHLGMELMKQRTGVDLVHVPYKGIAAAMTDLIGGQVQVMFGSIHSVAPHVKAGKLKVLGTTGDKRSTVFPETRTFAEQQATWFSEIDNWYAVLLPAKTPADVAQKIGDDFKAVLALPDVREQLGRQGLVPVTSTGTELATLIRSDLARWRKVVQDAGIKPD
jgi:tripartite-type tricarboxylate transporter receptor subunit TctC